MDLRGWGKPPEIKPKPKQYVIEYNGSKGWEVHSEYESWNTARNEFEHYVLNDIRVEWRLTAKRGG